MSLDERICCRESLGAFSFRCFKCSLKIVEAAPPAIEALNQTTVMLPPLLSKRSDYLYPLDSGGRLLELR
jgi:hypothetical protein